MIEEAVHSTLEAHRTLANDVRARVPRAWGALAAQGVVALRARLGRAPSESERRALWSALWEAVARLD